ncbi:hypothetical protein PB01_18755 [Psychrobacillus glaciei]|uniref:Uncharacterized protein n=1 Tax=Psychrobacillus glaciei TaxID=2283160 RepID=A0A5J6SRK4_9BACI|nr:hypothetical protein [Psychrobacillus glaciei]QFG00669.1 hypothetical protein PB01_18755 [Psychrobacillus glaciei]
MGDRKLLAALLTSIVSFFVLPLVFMQPYDTYFEVCLGVSIVSAPIIFTYGIFTSIWAERVANRREKKKELVMFALHGAFGIGFIGIPCLYPFWDTDFFMYGWTILVCGMICSIFYYFFDLFIRKLLIK